MLTIVQGWDYINHTISIHSGKLNDFHINMHTFESINDTNSFKLDIGLLNKYYNPLNIKMNITLNDSSQKLNLTLIRVIGSESFIMANDTFYPYIELLGKKEIYLEFEALSSKPLTENDSICVEIQSNMFPKNKNRQCLLIENGNNK
jgi:hypothetical protein